MIEIIAPPIKPWGQPKTLTPREKKIYKMRLIDKMHLHDVGYELDITGERVRQLENIMLNKIAKLLKINIM